MWSNDLRTGLGAKRKWGKEAAQKNSFAEQDVWSCCSPNFVVFSFGFQYILEGHSPDSSGMFTHYKITWLTTVSAGESCTLAGHFTIVTSEMVSAVASLGRALRSQSCFHCNSSKS